MCLILHLSAARDAAGKIEDLVMPARFFQEMHGALDFPVIEVFALDTWHLPVRCGDRYRQDL